MLKICLLTLIRVIFIAAFLFVGEPAVAQGNTSPARLFPTPDLLKPNVEFWKHIYATHSERDVVIHDSEDLGIIYEVVNLDSLFRNVRVSPRLEWKKIELIKKEYKALLRRLARSGMQWDSMTNEERRVAALFGDALNSRRLYRAARNIRGQSGLRERFKIGLERSGLYLSKMREIFEAEGLPLELLVLPHVESSFNYQAYSKFGAAGIWQFTRSTGRMYMTIDYSVDERLDPIRSTESAARLLKRNYEHLGNWPLAITAYNHGRTGMLRAKRRHGSDIAKIVQHYRSRSFGFASRNFYAEFLAALHVTRNYKFYFGEIEFQTPREYEIFETPDYITVNTLLDKIKIDLDEFAEFNPALRSPVLQSKRRIPRYFPIRIPKQEDVDIAALYAEIAPELKYPEQVRPEWHKVRRGENLTMIANRYRVSVREIMDLNNIRNAHRIYAGQNLQLPESGHLRASKPVIASTVAKQEESPQLADATDVSKKSASVTDIPPGIRYEPTDKTRTGSDESAGKQSHIVERDDIQYIPPKRISTTEMSQMPRNLDRIEIQRIERQSESIDAVMEMALPQHQVQLTRDMGIRVIQTAYVETPHASFRDIGFPENGWVVVEPDETLGHFADWLDVPTWRLRAVNRLSYSTPIQIGQRLLLTFENVTPEELHRRRIEFHQGIEEDFYRNFRVEGDMLYVVKRGDNIWDICNRQYEIPYWLVKKYNPDRDLFNLHAGDEIVMPVVEARQTSHQPPMELE